MEVRVRVHDQAFVGKTNAGVKKSLPFLFSGAEAKLQKILNISAHMKDFRFFSL